jgi:mycofactocin biosynthetic radical S-adenosylmethionine protein MftC
VGAASAGVGAAGTLRCAAPFAIHESFLAGNVRGNGGFARVWGESELFTRLREPQTGGARRACAHYDACRGGCMAAKFFTGLPLDGPDPECVEGCGEAARAGLDPAATPKPGADHSRRGPVLVTIGRRTDRACETNPLAASAVGKGGT